jgi:outer membrane protein assembly factor BamA
MLHFWTPDLGGTSLDVHASASYSIFKYQYYDLQVGLMPHEGERLPRVERGTRAWFPLSDIEKTAAAPGFNIYASVRYRDYPREDFYGVGSSSVRSDRTDYRLQVGLYEGIVRFRVSHLSLMGRAGWLQTAIRPGTDSAFINTEIANDEASAPGLLLAPDFVHLSGGAWLELRDEPGNPHQGASLGVAFSRFDDRQGDAFRFNRTLVDAREYIPLGSNRHVVALRQVASLDDPDAGSRVPFYLQSTLGGSAALRGYSSFRFREDKMLALAGEYRFELRPKVELALIYEAGKVFGEMGELDLHDLHRNWGVGIRLKSPRKVRLRVDVLRSPEATRVDIKLGPSY